MTQPRQAARAFLSSRRPRKTIQNDLLACIIDGLDIIYQEKYRKFLKKGVLCRLRGPGNSNRRRDLRLADGLSDPGGSAARRRASRSGKRTNPVVELLIFIEPRGVEGLEAGNRPSGYAGDCNFDG